MIFALLVKIFRTLVRLENKEDSIMANLDDLIAQVQKNEDAEASAVIVIQKLAAEMQASAGDPNKLSALVASMQTSAAALGAAIVAGTPAAPPADVPPAAPPADVPPAPPTAS